MYTDVSYCALWSGASGFVLVKTVRTLMVGRVARQWVEQFSVKRNLGKLVGLAMIVGNGDEP